MGVDHESIGHGYGLADSGTSGPRKRESIGPSDSFFHVCKWEIERNRKRERFPAKKGDARRFQQFSLAAPPTTFLLLTPWHDMPKKGGPLQLFTINHSETAVMSTNLAESAIPTTSISMVGVKSPAFSYAFLWLFLWAPPCSILQRAFYGGPGNPDPSGFLFAQAREDVHLVLASF